MWVSDIGRLIFRPQVYLAVVIVPGRTHMIHIRPIKFPHWNFQEKIFSLLGCEIVRMWAYRWSEDTEKRESWGHLRPSIPLPLKMPVPHLPKRGCSTLSSYQSFFCLNSLKWDSITCTRESPELSTHRKEYFTVSLLVASSILLFTGFFQIILYYWTFKLLKVFLYHK